jgi:hypothetical protein
MSLKLSTGLVNALLDTGSFKTIMATGLLCLYSGVQPASADVIETSGAILLLKVSVGSAAFTPTAGTNGLSWGDATLNVVEKASEVWSGVGLAAGVAGWFRFYDKYFTAGASTSAVRFDGRISTIGGGGEIELSSTTIAIGATTTITTASFTIPLS